MNGICAFFLITFFIFTFQTCFDDCTSKYLLNSKETEIQECLLSCKVTEKNLQITLKKLKSLKNILQSQIQLSESILSNYTMEQYEKASPPAGTQLRVASNVGLRVRRTPCTDGAIITTLTENTIVTAVGRAQTGCQHEWWLIRGSFGEGWSSSQFLVRNNNAICRQRNYPLYKQCDGRWGSDKLGSSSTICKVGCLITSVAMAMNGLGKQINGQNVTPKNFNQFLMNNGGYSGNLFIWGSVTRFGLRYLGQPTSIETIKNHICNNQIVALNIDRGGHWVLANGVNNDGSISILDPGPNRSSVKPGEVLRAGIYNLN